MAFQQGAFQSSGFQYILRRMGEWLMRYRRRGRR